LDHQKSRQFVPYSDAARWPISAQNTAEDPGSTRPERHFPSGAAQTRIVSVARIRLDSRQSVRSFKGIICGDISEFESRQIARRTTPMPRSAAWASRELAPYYSRTGRPSIDSVLMIRKKPRRGPRLCLARRVREFHLRVSKKPPPPHWLGRARAIVASSCSIPPIRRRLGAIVDFPLPHSNMTNSGPFLAPWRN
jgi:hypothetical protein